MVSRLCCVVLFFAVSQATRAAELHDQMERWLRNHKFEIVALEGDMTTGRLGSTFVVATNQFVFVKEKTFLTPRSWTSQLIDALLLAMPHDNLTMKTSRVRNRHAAIFYRSDDKLFESKVQQTLDSIVAEMQKLEQQKNQIQPEAELPKQ